MAQARRFFFFPSKEQGRCFENQLFCRSSAPGSGLHGDVIVCLCVCVKRRTGVSPKGCNHFLCTPDAKPRRLSGHQDICLEPKSSSLNTLPTEVVRVCLTRMELAPEGPAPWRSFILVLQVGDAPSYSLPLSPMARPNYRRLVINTPPPTHSPLPQLKGPTNTLKRYWSNPTL